MNKESILGIVRHVLTFGGGAVAAKGYGDSADMEQIVGAVLTIIGVVWSIVDKRGRASTPTPTAGKVALFGLAGLVAGALVMAGCQSARLEPGGAYAPLPTTNVVTGVVTPANAPDMAFYATDAAYSLAYASLDGAFTFEKANRAALWSISPNIKHTLDQVRPQAWAINVQYHKARAAYLAVPVPANLTVLQQTLAKAQQLLAAVSAVMPKQ